MIAAADRLEVSWLHPDVIDPGAAQPYDPDTVACYTAMMAGSPGAHLAPIVVTALADGRYRIRDGHHRYLAHLQLGRDLVRCVVVHPKGTTG